VREVYSDNFPYGIRSVSIILYFDFSVDKIRIIAYSFQELDFQLKPHFEGKNGIPVINAFI